MRESQLQKQIIDYCKRNKIYCVNIFGSGMTGKGTPDLLLCVNGRFVGLELKVGNNNPQPDQIIHGKRIVQSGGIWEIPRTLEQAVAIIERVKGGQSG